MTAKQYFKYAFLSPLILPFIVLLFEKLIKLLTGWNFGELTGLLLGSVIFGGIPYLIFLVGFYRWIKDKSASQIHLSSYLFPVFYMLIFLIWLVVYILIVKAESFDNIFSFLASEDLWGSYYTFGKIAVAIAYSYIILINAGYWLLKIGNKFSMNNKLTQDSN